MMVVNDAMLMRVLFKNSIRHTYNKTYQCSKNKTNHIIITNYE